MPLRNQHRKTKTNIPNKVWGFNALAQATGFGLGNSWQNWQNWTFISSQLITTDVNKSPMHLSIKTERRQRGLNITVQNGNQNA